MRAQDLQAEVEVKLKEFESLAAQNSELKRRVSGASLPHAQVMVGSKGQGAPMWGSQQRACLTRLGQ